jgi:hypothetical protein
MPLLNRDHGDCDELHNAKLDADFQSVARLEGTIHKLPWDGNLEHEDGTPEVDPEDQGDVEGGPATQSPGHPPSGITPVGKYIIFPWQPPRR